VVRVVETREFRFVFQRWRRQNGRVCVAQYRAGANAVRGRNRSLPDRPNPEDAATGHGPDRGTGPVILMTRLVARSSRRLVRIVMIKSAKENIVFFSPFRPPHRNSTSSAIRRPSNTWDRSTSTPTETGPTCSLTPNTQYESPFATTFDRHAARSAHVAVA